VSEDRELDVVIFGATGFAGRLVAGYLAGHAPGGVRVGLAGRSERRLADARAGLGADASDWPLLVADSADPGSLAALARRARVVVCTVGPYRARGLALVQACAGAGTDYADLTGEVLFIRDSIDRCHDVAAAAGARIVHCCGFDSVPSDLGVLGLHEAARADGAGDLEDTTLVVTALRGGVSGGTLASMMGQQAEMRASAQLRQIVADPYALSPDRAAEPGLGDERDPDWARYDGDLRMWTGPFAMAGINTRVVRRSNALQGWAYGRRFRYREVTGFGAGPAAPLLAGAASTALKAAGAGLAFGPSRAMLARLLPAPGQGPGERTRRTGYFRIQIHTRTSAGARYLGAVEAQGDPGYAATSVMLGETALCLALDRDQLPDRVGVLTPATAMGAALTARLRSAGHTLTTRQTTQLPGGPGRLPHTGGMIRLGTPADLAAASGVYRRASLSNAGDRDNLLAHPEYLVLGPEGLAEGRTHVAEQDGSVVGFATWAETAGTIELEDLFVDPGSMRRGIATALVSCIAEVLRARGAERLEVTANPHAMGFYRAAGFIDCGVAETNFGAAPRLVLVLC
jgi:short subunit dehydrogenase-like uncharacterized protein/ribosomal protein S18 acetylase RimI-like enzyme